MSTESPSSEPAAPGTHRRFGGMLVRRERWSLTLRAKLLLAAIIISVAIIAALGALPFLACHRPVAEADVLIVEGWIPEYAVDEARPEFERGGYPLILTAGGITGDGWDRTPPYTFADRAAERLQKLGLGEHVVAVPCHEERVDRTYHSALAVRQWLIAHGTSVRAINVITLGPHARRSRLLFEKAFGSDTAVGIIAVEDRTYDPDRWWSSSEGTRDVVGEVIAYLYARFLFFPEPPE